MAIEDAIKIAKGCLDYCGGYVCAEDAGKYIAFKEGIYTVIRALERRLMADEKGLDAELALRIRNLIAAREFNTAEANHELGRGGWLSDHRHEDNNLAAEIDALIEQANTGAVPRRNDVGTSPLLGKE